MEVRRSRQAGGRWRSVLGIVLVLLAIAYPAAAQTPTVAYVDLNRVLAEAPQVATARAALEAEFRERNRQLEQEQLSVDALRQELADEALLSAAPNEDLQRRIDSMERSLKRKSDALSRELDGRRQTELAQIDAMIGAAISELARARKLDLVLTDQVVYHSPRVDLTDAVIESLRNGAAQ